MATITLSQGIAVCSYAVTQLDENNTDFAVNNVKSYILMEESTGTILLEHNKDEELFPASITKIMTLILIFDEIKKGNLSLADMVTVSEHAAGMGGSQVFLEAGEKQKVDDLIKAISIASGNDASVAMAEHIAGSENEFVARMNERAKKLGMNHTHFMNCCGLDDTLTSGHYSTALDVAIMSRELIHNYPQISKYATTWMDVIYHKTKKGEQEFGLTNTNKLVRSFDGITGLKTGSTSKAGYCLSATANRDGVGLVAVIMAAKSPIDRFSKAGELLNYGFANVSVYKNRISEKKLEHPEVKQSLYQKIFAKQKEEFSYIFPKNEEMKPKRVVKFKKNLCAPIKKGDKVGEICYYFKGEKIGSKDLIAKNNVDKANFLKGLGYLLNGYLGKAL
ncbi:MAG: D-alanyl-D-alanine carboxypeptidase [Lachnospiraceae bacterium]|nr:D-alanyl-D-alanine carboxypeptidase [Lachnospiraceae bacterium]